MFVRFLMLLMIMSFVSCSTYKIAEGYLNRKMKRAGLTLHTCDMETEAQVEYWDSGDTTKPALMLVHGFGATTKYQWYKQVKVLSKKYRVIAPNLNYFGRTVPKSPDYTVQGQVIVMEYLLEHLELKEVTLMGVSYGGVVVMEFLEQTDRSVPAVVLFDTPVKYADNSDIEAVKNYFEAPSIEELFVPSEPSGINKLLYLATGKRRHIPKGMLRDFHEHAYAYNLEDKRKLISGLLGEMEILQKREYHVNVPILLIWGSQDRVVPLRTGKQLENYLKPNARLEVIDGAAHMPNMTHAKVFNNLVISFLQATSE
jgi:pimeloyl-ACP methyl ester carboxylesterase